MKKAKQLLSCLLVLLMVFSVVIYPWTPRCRVNREMAKKNTQGEIEATLQDTTNVVNFVRSREGERRPEPVPESQILTMLGHAEAREMEAADAVNDYVVGESVKVNFGPFSGFIGEIKEINAEKRELTVMVKVFGRETPLKLDHSQVERE